MSQQLISHSPDLKKLRDEGYWVEIRSNYLVIRNVPYVNSRKEVAFGVLVSDLKLAGDVTIEKPEHVVYFSGEHPCNKDGAEIAQIKHSSQQKDLDTDLIVHHSFSNKPKEGYKDYYEKMSTYATIISGPAESLDPSVTARAFPIIEADDPESVFHYIDTASSRADIVAITRKLELSKIAIVGLGGTGSYVLDLVAKTPVKEIHLFDGDLFSQHNAFRSPGAPSKKELEKREKKVLYFQRRYSKMHKGIVAHDNFIDDNNLDQLEGMDFVFLCIDNGSTKRSIIEKLEELDISFVDTGMGVQILDESLYGILRVTASTSQKRDHIRNNKRISFFDEEGPNEYSRNIQVADLNALSATLAVIKWKKIFGFYNDIDKEHHCTYTVDGNALCNEDAI
jgi:hypothetical protein